MATDDVRIIQFQTFVLGADVTEMVLGGGMSDEEFSQQLNSEVIQAESALASAVADGYEIVNVATGGNERVLLTTYTLRKADSLQIVDGGSMALKISTPLVEGMTRYVDER